MFDRFNSPFNARREDSKEIMVKIAYPIHGEEYVPQVDIEEATVQPSNAER